MQIPNVPALFVLFFYTCFERIESNNWVKHINQCIMKNVTPFQIAFFMNSKHSKEMKDFEFTFSLMQTYPSLIIDIPTLERSVAIDRYYNINLFSNPRSSTLYVILFKAYVDYSENVIYLQYFIDYFVQQSPRPTRPKCLVIFQNKIGKNISESFFENILKYGWSRKFLDFSVIEINLDNNLSFLHYFNPFHGLYNKILFDCNGDIFPEKFKDLNGYSLNISDRYSKPVVNDEEEFMLYAGMSLIAKILNAHLNRILTLGPFSVYYKKSFQLLENKTTNMFSNSIMLHTVNTYEYEFYLSGFCRPYVALVPIIPIKEFYFSFHAFVRICFVFTALVCLIYLVRIFKIINKKLSTLNILLAFSGAPTTYYPRKMNDKIVFLTIIFVSMIYVTNLYSEMINMRIIHKEIAFDTLKEINESGMIFEINRISYNHVFSTSNEFLQSIKKRTSKVKNIESCVDTLILKNNIICLANMRKAKEIISQVNNRKLFLKIAKPYLTCARQVIPFEKASPYLEIFTDIFQKLYESGILLHTLRKNIWQYNGNKIKYSKVQDEKYNENLRFILFLLSLSLLSTLVIFFVELKIRLMRKIYRFFLPQIDC